MTRHQTRKTTCPNCGRGDIGHAAYCPDCGQENRELEVPFRHLVAEVLEHTLHLDSKLFRTAAALLFRPGFLTREFVEGRRRRFVPPVRLYVFASVLFFFLLAVVPGEQAGERISGGPERNTLNLSLYTLDSDVLAKLDDAQIDSAMAANSIEPTPINRYAARKLASIARGGKAEFAHLMMRNISYMMFVLMPLFAFFVFLSFRRSARFYLRSLIYSVHLHSFLFLLLTVNLFAGRLLPFLAMLGAVALVCLVYFYLSLLRLYREPAVRTFLKAVLLGALYLVSMVACFIVVVFASMLLF